MKYLCVNCNYIYDEDLWDKTEWIKSWTKFEKLWDSFVCPVCGEYKDSFHWIKDEVIYLEDFPKDWLEAEHFILSKKLDNWKTRFTVWFSENHPSWEEHRISSIWIYDEYGDIVYEEFFEAWEEAILDFDVSDLDEYEIRARCLIHWVWGRKF
jgi:rubredoxin/desulfoferrodoxin (superoxide reductase-like protein)